MRLALAVVLALTGCNDDNGGSRRLERRRQRAIQEKRAAEEREQRLVMLYESRAKLEKELYDLRAQLDRCGSERAVK